uniref:Uncharacterized protein n=1 Tax=Plectus sambesii TaxID=2011161 RepID=A0A914V9G4_9BILA
MPLSTTAIELNSSTTQRNDDEEKKSQRKSSRKRPGAVHLSGLDARPMRQAPEADGADDHASPDEAPAHSHIAVSSNPPGPHSSSPLAASVRTSPTAAATDADDHYSNCHNFFEMLQIDSLSSIF